MLKGAINSVLSVQYLFKKKRRRSGLAGNLVRPIEIGFEEGICCGFIARIK